MAKSIDASCEASSSHVSKNHSDTVRAEFTAAMLENKVQNVTEGKDATI
jgi:hypothetical protein